MATKLDDFLQDKKEEEFTIGEGEKLQTFTAKYTGRNILKLTSVYNQSKLALDDKIIAMIEIVFGKEQSNILIDSLDFKGLTKIMTSIVEGLGLDSPS